MKILNILFYLLVRSTGKPEETYELDNMRIEVFHFNFGYWGMTVTSGFEKKKKGKK